MNHLLSRFKHVLLVPALLLTLCAMSLVAPHAHAASAGQISKAHMTAPLTNTANCSSLGSLIEYQPISNNGTQIGEMDVYYNSSTGYNCAYTYSDGPSWGVAKNMWVSIWACTQTTPGTNCTPISLNPPYHDQDSGTYSYYAGPVGVYGKGHCIVVHAGIWWGGVNNWVSTQPNTGHCS